MSAEENKAIVRRAIEALNARSFALVNQFIAPNFVDHSPIPGQTPGAKAMMQSRTALHTEAFPDLHNAIEDMIADGEKVVVRVAVSGTHKGEFMGVAPTNKRVSWTSIIIYRIVNGKAVERWANTDTLGILQQLGAVPPLG